VGYLISRRGAQKFLAPRPRYWPIDTDIRRPWHFGLNVFGVCPSLVAHNEEVPSIIGGRLKRSRGRRGIKLPSRASWTGNPLHDPAALPFNLGTLGTMAWVRCFAINSKRRLANILRKAVMNVTAVQAS